MTQYFSAVHRFSNKSKTCCHLASVGNERGSVAVMAALALTALLGFAALGAEVGRWYLVEAELSKSVDAAALVGANNISNPELGPGEHEALMREVALSNFPAGTLGTEVGGSGEVTFTIPTTPSDTAEVDGTVTVKKYLTQMFVPQDTVVSTRGVAKRRDVEIMMILDRSGSMYNAMEDLKTAANSFVDYFADTQDTDKVGLVTFSYGVSVYPEMGHNFVSEMHSTIDAMNAGGWTNSEHAIDASDNPGGFTDQSSLAPEDHVKQVLIFFSDGNPTAFTVSDPAYQFVRDGNAHPNAVVSASTSWYEKLHDPETGNSLGVYQYKTGDGLPTSGSTTTSCSSDGHKYSNMKWGILEHPDYGAISSSFLSASDIGKCNVSRYSLSNYVVEMGKQMAIDHAQELKDKGIEIYTIGLGNVDRTFLETISSGENQAGWDEYALYTPNAGELESLFKKVAKNIKLRLVE